MASPAEEVLKPTLLLAKLTGMYPFRFVDHRMSFELLLILLVCTFYILVYYLLLVPQIYARLSKSTDYMLLLMNSFVVLNNLVTTYSFIVYREDAPVFWDSMDRCDLMLARNNMVPRHVTTLRSQTIDVVRTIVITFLVYGSSFFIFGNPFLFSSVCVIRVAAIRLLFLTLCDQLESRLHRLNWELKDYSRRFPPFLIPAADPGNPFREFDCVTRERRKYFARPDLAASRGELTFETIRSLNGIHKHLADAVGALNNLFGPQLFCILTATVGTNVITGCSTVVVFLYADISDRQYYIFHLIRLIFNVYCVFSVVKKCDDLQREAKKTGPLIHEILDEDYPERVVEELELFSYLAACRSFKMEAAGFFDVELKMLPTVISILTPGMIYMYKSLKPVEKKVQAVTASYENDSAL